MILKMLVPGCISVTRNKITDNYRKKKSDSLEDYTYEDEDGSFSIKEILLADDSNNPELKMFKDIFWDELMKALDELPDNQRRVFFRMKLRKRLYRKLQTKKVKI